MRAVNLLPRDLAKQKRLTQQQLPAVVGAGLGVVVTGALALGFMHASGQLRDAQARYNVVEAELHNTPKPATVKPPENADLAGEQSARLTAVSTALGGRLAWDRILREFSLVLPSDVWLNSLTMSYPDPAAAPAGTPQNTFSLSGYTYSHDSVARLLARLALIPELSGITLANSTLQQAPAGSAGTASATPSGTVQFTISAAVAVPPGAAALTAPPPPPPPPPSTDTSTNATATS